MEEFVKIKKPFKFALGLFFLLFGFVYLLINLNVIADFTFVEIFRNFWAFGLIIAGIMYLLHLRSAGFVVLILSLMLGLVFLIVPVSDFNYETKVIHKSADFNSEVNSIDLNINFGGSEFVLEKLDDDSKLVDVTLESDFDDNLDFLEEMNIFENDTVFYTINQRSNDEEFFYRFFSDDRKSVLTVKVDGDVESLIDLNYGASKSLIDLRGLNVKELEIGSGATQDVIYFDENVNAKISTGAADISLYFPKDKNILVDVDGGLVDVDFPSEFNKRGNLYFNNVTDMEKIDIYLEIDSGVSSIKGGFYDE